MNQDEASIVAILAIIGGADNRVRLGGTVENEEHGIGIVTRIAKSGKISVQCSDEQIIRNSPLSLWKVVCIVKYYLNEVKTTRQYRIPPLLSFKRTFPAGFP